VLSRKCAEADNEGVSRPALIGMNAFASAACFVASLLVASQMPGLLGPATVVLGFLGLAYFLKRAERARGNRP
jgi:hypothetical protein